MPRSYEDNDAGMGIAGVAAEADGPVKAEPAARRETEARYSAALAIAKLGTFEWNVVTHEVVLDERSREIFGFGPDEGRTAQEVFARIEPSAVDRFRAEAAASAAAQTRLETEYPIRRPDGTLRFVVSISDAIPGADGATERLIGVFADITDRKRAESALRESEARFRHMADSAPALIWMSDETGHIVFANMHYDYLFGRPASEMTGEGWRQVVLPEDLPAFERAFFDAFADRRPLRLEVRVRDRHGAVRWLRCEGVPRLDDAHRFLGYTGCNVDITESKVAEERRNLLINELNHRVKNTLATVQSIASQTLRNAETFAEAKEAIEGRLIALSRTHDVLTRESWEGAELDEIVRQAVAPYSSPGENRLHLEGPAVRLPPRIALALAMMLQELATNAVKYGALSNAAGTVRIAWSVEPGAAPQLHLRWEESGGPPVRVPTRRGFGTRLIERSLAHDLGGTVRIDFAETGVVCTVSAILD